MHQRSITTTIIAVITMNDGHYPFWFVLCSKFSRSILYISIPDGWSDPSITSTTTTMTLLCTTNSPHYFNQNKMYCFTNMDYFPLVIWFTIFLFILYRYIYIWNTNDAIYVNSNFLCTFWWWKFQFRSGLATACVTWW